MWDDEVWKCLYKERVKGRKDVTVIGWIIKYRGILAFNIVDTYN